MDTLEQIIAFKGDRGYVHGPDVFEHMTEILAENGDLGTVTKIRYGVHDFIRTNAVLFQLFPTAADVGEGDWPFVMTADVNGVSKTIAARENPHADVPVTRRPVDEDAMQRRMTMEGSEMSFDAIPSDSAIEVAVAMKKSLMQAMFPQEKVKWVFVRAEFASVPLNRDQRLQVVAKTRAPSRIYRSSLLIDGVDIGTLYFIGIKQ